MSFLNKSKVFYQFFISYFFIFLIPLLSLGGFIYFNAVSSLTKEIETSNINSLTQVKNMIDLQMKGLDQLAAKVAYDPLLSRYMIKNDRYKEAEAIKEIARYKAQSEMLDDMFLYFMNDDVVYSSEGLNSLTTLTRYYYKFDSDNEQRFIHDLTHANVPLIRPAKEVEFQTGEKKRILTYIVPIDNNSVYARGAVVFMIKESVLSSWVNNMLGDYAGNVYILDENKTILASKSKGTSFAESELNMIFNKYDNPGVYNEAFLQHRYSFASVKSDFNHWSFITIMPTTQFYSHVMEKKIFYAILFLSLVVLGLGMAYILSVGQYQPFQKMSGLIDRQKPLVRKQFLTGLLKGEWVDPPELKAQLAEQGLRLEGPNYMVLLLSFDMSDTHGFRQRLESISERIGELVFGGWNGYGVDLIKESVFAVIVNIQHHDWDKNSLSEIARQIQNDLQGSFNVTPAIGVSRVYSDPSMLQRCFIEASAAIEHRLGGGSDSILFFDDIQQEQDRLTWYAEEMHIRFIHSIKQGEATEAVETLRLIIQGIRNDKMPVFVLKCICFDLINSVLKTVHELNITDYPEQLKNLVEFATIEMLEERLAEFVRKVCLHVKKLKNSKNTALRDDLLKVIQTHFRKHDLSLESLSAEFGLSASYLSRFLKEQIGCNFSEYVLHLRLEQIKRELKLTEKPVKAIITDSGYIDVSYVIKKFKQIEGVTPSVFRKLHVK